MSRRGQKYRRKRKEKPPTPVQDSSEQRGRLTNNLGTDQWTRVVSTFELWAGGFGCHLIKMQRAVGTWGTWPMLPSLTSTMQLNPHCDRDYAWKGFLPPCKAKSGAPASCPRRYSVPGASCLGTHGKPYRERDPCMPVLMVRNGEVCTAVRADCCSICL